MHAHATVNDELARDVGIKILNDMNGKTPANYFFKKKDQALAVKSSVKVQDDNLQVDPDLLFHRLASFAAKLPDSLENAFVYELCSYPPALFDSSLFLREPQKSQFGDAIWSMIQHPEISLPTDVQYVQSPMGAR